MCISAGELLERGVGPCTQVAVFVRGDEAEEAPAGPPVGAAPTRVWSSAEL